MPTIAEIAQARQVPLSSGIFKAVQTEAPALSAFDARTAAGTKFITLALTGLPSSAFVNLNEGFTASSATLAVREFDASLIGGLIKEEVISAQRWNQAHAASGTTYFDLQTTAKMIADMKHIEKVMFYGTAQDAKGFPGLKELTPYSSGNSLSLTADPGADDYTKTFVNAAGTTATTASSVYSVIFGEMDAQLVVCNDGGGELLTMTEIIEQMMAPDPDAATALSLHRVAQVYGFLGLSVSGMNQTPASVVPTQYSVRRLGNLTEDSGKGVTDAKLEQLVLSHGDNKVPNMLFMNGRSGRQWADSRSASSASLFLGMSGDARNNTGSLRAKRPDSFEGIPVTYTSAIRSTDAIES
jgi:hypothetical protein